ncbi:S8 family serine peptidase [Mycoplasma seminis]|uniref:S8 family serine peptidase n=1 Tax=Mycoplasma seminis TaxID=512749 RepID=A0ABY9HB54_9MOLU|nr:S8 family serine peptidase [Mycoplasma seminis]WLP85573.1 S8 family serine peptidase [Mycoplasma seminis]
MMNKNGVYIMNFSYNHIAGTSLYNSELNNLNTTAKNVDLEVIRQPENILVFSAGNDNDEKLEKNRYINGQQLSLNSIVVGSHDRLLIRSSFSSYLTKGRTVDLLANGERYFNEDIKEMWYGTSFSAPFVTGVISLLKDKYPYIFDEGHDSIIAKSIIHTSSKNKNRFINQTGLNEDGVGALDASKCDESIKSLVYLKFRNSEPENKNKNIYNFDSKLIDIKTVYLEKNDTVRGDISWLWDGKTHTNGDAYINDFDLYLYDEDGNEIAKSNSSNINSEFIRYTAQKDGNYTFKIKYFKNINESDIYKNSKRETDVAFTATVEGIEHE